MPSSIYHHISDVVGIVRDIKPNKILDIGVGFGKWGFLFREYLDVFGNKRIYKSDWQIIIDGVEVFDRYIQDHQKFIYNTLFFNNIIDIVDDLNSYDLIFMGDVLEHFKKDVAYHLLTQLKEKSKDILIALPLGVWPPQGTVLGNENEAHLSVWEVSNFSNIKFSKTYSISPKRIYGLIHI